MKINLRVRLKNPYFYVGLAAILITATGAEIEMFTSWDILFKSFSDILKNPFLILCTIVSVIGYINDPTTAGLNDSKEALAYFSPKKESKK